MLVARAMRLYRLESKRAAIQLALERLVGDTLSTKQTLAMDGSGYGNEELQGADGVVFVADSNPGRQEENIESFRNLQENLLGQGIDPRSVPICIQYNKRDLENAMRTEELRAQLNPMGVPDFEAVAIEGKGVFETLTTVSKSVVKSLS